MKKKPYIILLVIAIIPLLSCGSDDNQDNGANVSEFILSATVTNMAIEDINIDNPAKTMTLSMLSGLDKSKVRIKLVLGDNVSMVSPKSLEADYDLTNTAYIRLLAGNEEINFKIETNTVHAIVDPESIGWTKVTDKGDLKDGITVYKSPSSLQNKNAVAYIAVGDTKKGIRFDVLGQATGYKTPTRFYESTDRQYSIIINGGYFYNNRSLSMIWRNGAMVTPNLRSEGRSNGHTYFFTRGIFSQTKTDEYRTDWTYTTNTNETYAYPLPLPNNGGDPLPEPSATYPAGAWSFDAQTAIGGGPVLIKDGEYVNSWLAEVFDAESGVGPTSNNPRTAIGITSDRRIILFVCEGRNKTPGVPGYNLQEVANIMLQLGCIEVLNLDGGGSSCMLVNGNETIIPSDAAGQRAVASAVILK